MRDSFVPDETVLPTLATVSGMEEVEGGWVVRQDYTPRPRHLITLWEAGLTILPK